MLMFQWHEGIKALGLSVVEYKSRQKCEGCEPAQVGTRIQARRTRRLAVRLESCVRKDSFYSGAFSFSVTTLNHDSTY